MLQFDENGHLTPYAPIETTLDEFQQVFVDAFPRSTTRKRLFDNYLDWVFDFQRDIFGYFTQWIDGSFVTRKENPNDIDFVTFLDVGIFFKREKTLERFWSFNNEDKGLDAYIMAEFPQNSSDYEEYQKQLNTWARRFNNTQKGQTEYLIQKGFIQIHFSK